MKVFVYGATGQIGSLIVDELLEAGNEVLAGTRHPEKQNQKPGLKWVEVDAVKPGSGLNALAEVDSAFLMSPPFHTDQHAVLNPWIQEAKKVGLKKVVLMTAVGVEMAPPEAPFRKIELALIESGLPHNIIRPNWFMQNFNTFWVSGILAEKTIFFPGGNAKTAFIDVQDIADSAAVLLQSDEHNNKHFSLSGPESLTHTEVAKILSETTGIEIQYMDLSPEDFRSGLIGAGVPEDYSDLLVMLAGSLKEGHCAGLTDSVKTLVGRDPIRFADYAKAHKDSFLQAQKV